MTENVTIPDDIKALKFEEALEALEDIVKKLESGSVSLEQSIDIYTRGTALRQHCDDKLKDASERIEKITQAGDKLSTQPFDVEAS